MHISIVNFHCIHFEIILNISSICYTFNNTIHNSYLFKLQHIEICINMYHHEHYDDYKFILMWFLDIGDEVHGVTSAEYDSDHNSTSHVCKDRGKSFLILTSYQNWITYEVNCSIYWYDFLYDFVMLHVCYIYCDILNYDVTISHHTYSYINYQF